MLQLPRRLFFFLQSIHPAPFLSTITSLAFVLVARFLLLFDHVTLIFLFDSLHLPTNYLQNL